MRTNHLIIFFILACLLTAGSCKPEKENSIDITGTWYCMFRDSVYVESIITKDLIWQYDDNFGTQSFHYIIRNDSVFIEQNDFAAKLILKNTNEFDMLSQHTNSNYYRLVTDIDTSALLQDKEDALDAYINGWRERKFNREEDYRKRNPKSTAESDKIQEEEIESDCVFNNDYKSLTTEWMKELRVQTYSWDDVNKRTVLIEGADSIYFRQGGCAHFGFSVEQVLTSNTVPLADSTYWIQASLKFAERFGFDHYAQSIKAGKVNIVHNDTGFWFEVDDDDPEDNLFYTGIEITAFDRARKIGISFYYN